MTRLCTTTTMIAYHYAYKRLARTSKVSASFWKLAKSPTKSHTWRLPLVGPFECDLLPSIKCLRFCLYVAAHTCAMSNRLTSNYGGYYCLATRILRAIQWAVLISATDRRSIKRSAVGRQSWLRRVLSLVGGLVATNALYLCENKCSHY